MPPETLPGALADFAEALVIGLIIGAQREASHHEEGPGVRDFLLIALTGGICGFLGNTWLTAAALVAVAVLVTGFHLQSKDRSGITTELAALATFCLAVLATTPARPASATLAVGAAIVVVVFLEAKRSLHRLIRETITEAEFNDTIWFLAIIFIVYPALPEGDFGPYAAFNPRSIWFFVILVSSISFVGYFLQRFLGSRKGLVWTAVLGGLASTTASTLAFARESTDDGSHRGRYLSATVIANAVQFPRVLFILWMFNEALARASLGLLLAMAGAGLVLGFILYRRGESAPETSRVAGGNPFRLLPALKFGAVFAAVVFASKAAAAQLGGQGLYWAGAVGGTVDADAVAVSLAGLQDGDSLALATAVNILYVALVMNAALKTGLAFYSGGSAFGWRVALGFLAMFGTGLVVLLV